MFSGSQRTRDSSLVQHEHAIEATVAAASAPVAASSSALVTAATATGLAGSLDLATALPPTTRDEAAVAAASAPVVASPGSRAHSSWLAARSKPEPSRMPSSWQLASRAGLGSEFHELRRAEPRAGSARLVSSPKHNRTTVDLT